MYYQLWQKNEYASQFDLIHRSENQKQESVALQLCLQLFMFREELFFLVGRDFGFDIPASRF